LKIIDVERNSVMSASRQFAIVTGASTGIGLELAKCCAREGFDLLIAADEPEIDNAAATIRQLGANVDAVQADLSTSPAVSRRSTTAPRRFWIRSPLRCAKNCATPRSR
jgi:uncharacterized protein